MAESGVAGIAGARKQGAMKDSGVQAEKIALGPSHCFGDLFIYPCQGILARCLNPASHSAFVSVLGSSQRT